MVSSKKAMNRIKAHHWFRQASQFLQFNVTSWSCLWKDCYNKLFSGIYLTLNLDIISFKWCQGNMYIGHFFKKKLCQVDITTSDNDDHEIEENIAHNCRINGVFLWFLISSVHSLIYIHDYFGFHISIKYIKPQHVIWCFILLFIY